MRQLTTTKRLLFGGIAAATVALGIGGVAYATGGEDPVPDQGYVTLEDSATTPSPGADGRDCPEKGGSTQGDGTQGDGAQPADPQGQA